MAAPVAMQPVEAKAVMAVHGGHLAGHSKYQAMLIELKVIEEKQAMVVDKKDTRMVRFLGSDFAMVDYIIS